MEQMLLWKKSMMENVDGWEKKCGPLIINNRRVKNTRDRVANKQIKNINIFNLKFYRYCIKFKNIKNYRIERDEYIKELKKIVCKDMFRFAIGIVDDDVISCWQELDSEYKNGRRG